MKLSELILQLQNILAVEKQDKEVVVLTYFGPTIYDCDVSEIDRVEFEPETNMVSIVRK